MRRLQRFSIKEDYGEALKKYEQDNGFKQRVQKAISDYLNSQDASQLYDTLATDVLADTYNYEELKNPISIVRPGFTKFFS